jgi:beta-galactosidase
MEEMGQPHGMVLYRHKARRASTGALEVDRLADYAIVSVDGQRAGTLDRRLDQKSLDVSLNSGNVLEVLVDAMGHVNFSRRMQDDRKGIAGARLAGAALEGWDVYSIPLTAPPTAGYQPVQPTGPAFYRARFNIDAPGDTYLDMSGWGKGYVWVNGYNLGRYWSLGPQQALYVPAGWLRAGGNEIVVLDLDPGGERKTRGVTRPIWRMASTRE